MFTVRPRGVDTCARGWHNDDRMLARLFRDLAPFEPTLVGTFPLGLQVEGSDLDVVCRATDLDGFERAVRASLDTEAIAPDRVEHLALDPPAVVVAFAWHDVAVEVFCQPTAVHRQHGFRHMVMEG